ncbi:MAG: oligosaccharide flippase family protein [Anaerolineae bacterium]|nr:oligosaccharide flippase family protein [Anaerolineae bacterium]
MDNVQKPIVSNKASFLHQLIAHLREPLHRNAYLLAFSTASASLLGAIYWVLAARFYPAEEVGMHSAIVSSVMFLSGLAQLDLINVLNRFIPNTGRLTTRFVAYCYLLAIVASVIASIIFIVGQPIWAQEGSLIENNLPYILWFTIAVVTWSIFSLQDSVLTGLRNANWIPVENISANLLRIVLLALFAASFPFHGILASWTIPIFLAILPMNYLIFRRLIPIHEQAQITTAPIPKVRQIATFAAGNYVGTLFFICSTLLLPLIVVGRAGAEANAYFYIVWVIRGSLDLIPMNMAQSLTAEGALDQANLPLYMRKMWAQMMRLLLPIVLILCLAAPLVLTIFGASYSANGSTLLRLVVLAVIPKTLIILYLGAARVLHQPKRIIAIQGSLCILVLGLSFPLLDTYGIDGVGFAWLISHALVAGALMLQQLRGRVRAQQSSTQGTRFTP